MKVLLIIVAVLAVLILGKFLLVDKASESTSPILTQDSNPPVEDKEEAEESAKADLIQVDSPKAGDLIASPVTITGKARGVWYFEASFPITILDETGKVLGRGLAEANPLAGGDWMTSEFVPFISKVTFTKSPTKTGTILLEKDNPSGLPEHADSIRISIRFE